MVQEIMNRSRTILKWAGSRFKPIWIVNCDNFLSLKLFKMNNFLIKIFNWTNKIWPLITGFLMVRADFAMVLCLFNEKMCWFGSALGRFWAKPAHQHLYLQLSPLRGLLLKLLKNLTGHNPEKNVSCFLPFERNKRLVPLGSWRFTSFFFFFFLSIFPKCKGNSKVYWSIVLWKMFLDHENVCSIAIPCPFSFFVSRTSLVCLSISVNCLLLLMYLPIAEGNNNNWACT